MYAVIETGGKQVKVEVGQEIFVEKLEAEAGKKFTFDKVLLVSDKTTKVGDPYIKGATVEAEVLKQGRGKKIVVFKYEPKKQFHTKKGHRQAYTKLVIKAINATKKAPAKKAEAPVAEEVSTEVNE